MRLDWTSYGASQGPLDLRRHTPFNLNLFGINLHLLSLLFLPV
jgi:hypothetical protein